MTGNAPLIDDAKRRGITFLDKAEAAAERGAKKTSDRLYGKAKYWLARYRKLRDQANDR